MLTAAQSITTAAATNSPTAPANSPACLNGNGRHINEASCSARDDLRCYALPYGGLGFISDMLTLYTIWMLSHGYTPWFPKRELKGGWPDMILAGVGSCGTVVSTIYTIVRCRGRWAFVLIAIWKLFLSICLNAMVFHAAFIRRGYRYASTLIISRWTWLYGIGLAFGLAGLFDLAFVDPGHQSHTLLTLGSLLASLPLVRCGLALFVALFDDDLGDFLKNLSFPFHDDELLDSVEWWPWLQLLSAFAVNYGIATAVLSNWILAAIAIDNWSGKPSSDSTCCPLEADTMGIDTKRL